jgi:hypothetical protein
MTRLLAAGAVVTLLLGVTRALSAPIAIATLGIATVVLYWLARTLAGRNAARATTVLLLASELPYLLDLASPPAPVSIAVVQLLSLPWWLPLVAAAWLIRPDMRRTFGAVLGWWAGVGATAVLSPVSVGTAVAFVESAPAALLAGLAVAGLAELSNDARRRLWLAGALTTTSALQVWLVLGTGRPARFMVPLIVAALLVAATDLVTDEEPASHDAVGAALVIAMVVFGMMPGAYALIEQRQMLADLQAPPVAPRGADVPSSFDAP